MADVMGQRGLLGLGVLLAWLLLFHLLVNIWLLCVFTSLLVVLGGWLSSQAVLESDSVLHLERFIPLEQTPLSPEDEQHLDQEIQHTVRKIIRDFVSSWYSSVSSEGRLEAELHQAMSSMATELKLRARGVDRKDLAEKILHVLGGHLQDFLEAKEQQVKSSAELQLLWAAYSSISTPHPALSSPTEGVNYIRAVAGLLLRVLVPPPHLETRSGRFVVEELVSCSVLLPLVEKLSDPDWLNLLIIDVFGESNVPLETAAGDLASPSQHAPCAELEQGPISPPEQAANPPQVDCEAPGGGAEDGSGAAFPEVAPCDVLDSGGGEFTHSLTEDDAPPFLRHFMRGSKANPFYLENDSDLDSPLAEDKPGSIDSLLIMGRGESLFEGQQVCGPLAENSPGLELEEKITVSLELVEDPRTAGGAHSSQPDLDQAGSCAGTPHRELLLSVEQAGNELSVVSPLQGGPSMPAFSFEPLCSPEGPVLIQNLRITGTITAKEHRGTGSHPYTLYTIKYETSMACEKSGGLQSVSEDGEAPPADENLSPGQPVAYHMVNRRYSEFLNLQTRLEEKAELRRLIKGVKGPKKMFPEMPFGNMDSERIEARKGLLETFLKHLCAMPEIANSEEMQEFLALNTDARIAFVKKPFIVSRIDKMVVSAIVDTLKTAFPRSEPQSPTEDNDGEVDGGKMCADKRSRSRLKLSGKSVPFMNGSDVRAPVLFSCDQTATMFNGMSLGDLEAFLDKQEKLSAGAEEGEEGRPGSGQQGGCVDVHRAEQSQTRGEMALAEVALNLLCLLMKQQWSWLCSENVQKAVRLLFGTLIDRWLDVSVADLTSIRYWVVYLQVIQEAVWPGGVLPAAAEPERSQQQKELTKQRALESLMRLVPDAISELLGSEPHRLSWQTVLDSFQDPLINRHLVFCLLDLLLDHLVPEAADEAWQRAVLQNPPKNPEKLLD
ncbi:sorting nexin-19 [Oryzias melastigma]|uniref:Sorting nexin 19b n=1 Tax=Oryzias melastigma TaxID=30732 RepID=A0A3B3BSZ0_ORYME|nr:sorting nexin-19 [Oryzias melastigma]XP_036070673.1 sorting nexin-19 [Oryzias melastigma]XP_036070674.1 sorting nexin-19 [Oryzias melastigma]